MNRFRVRAVSDPDADNGGPVTVEVPMAEPHEQNTARRLLPSSEPRGSLATAHGSVSGRASICGRPPAPDPTSLVVSSFGPTKADLNLTQASQLSLQLSSGSSTDEAKGKQGTFNGVYLPTCETMWVR